MIHIKKNFAKGFAIGLESLVALLIGMSMITLFLAKFYISYSGAQSYSEYSAGNLELRYQLQRCIYLAYYSNLSLQGFKLALSESGFNFSIVPFYLINSSATAGARVVRLISLQGKAYFVVVR